MKKEGEKEKKESKKGASISCLQGSKIHAILDTIIKVTLILCFVNECKRYVMFLMLLLFCFVNELIPAQGLACSTLTVVFIHLIE